MNALITWLYRIALLVFLFGVSTLAYGSDPRLEPVLTAVTNLAGAVAAFGLLLGYFYYPRSYKVFAWLITLGIIGLVLESLHIYHQYIYSFFVIKRFAYCGLALLTYVVISRSGMVKLSWAVTIIWVLLAIAQVALGRIFSYGLTSESRTTNAYEAFYLVLPFVYYLVCYLQLQKRVDLLKALFTFALIVFLLHRSVISSAVFAAFIAFGLSFIGKAANTKLHLGKTLLTLFVLTILTIPFMGALSPKKTAAFLKNIGGILTPTEDETGSWRVEQSRYYWRQIPKRPLLGWRYEGYDRGEIMENEDFAAKGTVIHSQYVDMLYNYGAVGLALNLLLIGSTLLAIYRRNRKLSPEQVILFSFIASGLLFGISYQLPVYFWGFVGVGMYYGLNRDVRAAHMIERQETESEEIVYEAVPVN